MINIIVHHLDREYFSILRRERRYKKTYEYFTKFNRWQIDPIELDESKIFNSTDLYYINTNRLW